MALPVYSQRFINVAGFTGSAAFECPAGFRMIVRDIDVTVFTGAGATVEAGVGGGAVFWGFTFGVVAILAWQPWRGRQVLEAGEQLVLQSDASADMMASGYLLSLP